MTSDRPTQKQWLLTGCLSGLGANILYIAASVGLESAAPPLRLIYPVAWLFGPLVVVMGVALAEDLAARGHGLLPVLGRILMTTAGGLVTVAIMIRGIAENRVWPARPEDASYAAKWAADDVQNAIMLVQRGVEMAWEVFIFLALLVFAAAMLRQRGGERVLGGVGALLAALGLAFTVAVWPADPDAEGLFAVGPFAGIWFMIVALRMGWRWRALNRQEVAE